MASRMKVLLLGGIAVAAGTVAYLKRDRVAGLLPSRTQTPAPPPPPNYDAPGPPANTATPVPAPEPQVQPAGLDEQAEAELTENAVLREAGTTGAQEQIEEAIEQQHTPLAGEVAEPPAVPVTDQPTVPDQQAAQGPDEPSPAVEQQPDEPASPKEPAPPPDDDDGGWKTWSGRSIGS